MSAAEARFRRLEQLAHEVLELIAEVNDASPSPAVDPWSLNVAAVRLERDLDAARTILKAGQR